MMNKSEIRKQVKIQKNQLTEIDKLKYSEKALANLESLIEFQNSINIGLFHSLNDEVNTHSFIEKWSHSKNIFLPRIAGDKLEMVKYVREDDLNEGKFKIKEPSNKIVSELKNLDIIIIPAVALSCTGQRIGRGKGYYDRLLNNSDILKIGLIYDFQLYPFFKSEQHDVPMDVIVTDKGILYLNK